MFLGCSSLETVTLSSSITHIGDNAFLRCSGLKAVYCPVAIPPEAGSDPENLKPVVAVGNSATLYVPTSAVDDYKNNPQWNTFSKIEGFDFPGGTVGVESGLAESLKVYVVGATLHIDGLNPGEDYAVYGVDGKTLASGVSTGAEITREMPNGCGVILVKAAGAVYKMLVK